MFDMNPVKELTAEVRGLRKEINILIELMKIYVALNAELHTVPLIPKDAKTKRAKLVLDD